MKLSALAVATALFSGSIFAAPLTLQIYNPQEKGLFAVNSTLVSGPHEAVLFDAQFSVKDGEKLVDMIRKWQAAHADCDHLWRSGFLFWS